MEKLEACKECNAHCCRSVAINLNVGKDMRELLEAHYGREIDTLKVKISHDCMHITEDYKCGIYEDRPKICRNFVCPEMRRPNVLNLEI